MYVIAADIIDLHVTRPDFDEFVFKPWLRSLENMEFFDRTLRSCHEDRPNNWGTTAGHLGSPRRRIERPRGTRGRSRHLSRMARRPRQPRRIHI